MYARAGLIALVLAVVLGTASADQKFQWRGEVDGVDEIQIRGDSVRINHLQDKPIQNQDYRFSEPLPGSDVHLKLEKISGRGHVQVVEEPNSWNDYTATIRIDDGGKGGADRYELELHWRSEGWNDWDNNTWDHSDEWEDSWQHRREGMFRWSGRVDVGAEIQIRGDQHRIEDAGGSGTQEQRSKFSDALPGAEVPVSLHKIHGRGRVELVQSPSRSNDYTAVVRIKDDKGGADEYEFELTWRN